MKYPNFQEEKMLWDQDFKHVVGLDESGRGPLAGPVVAAAVTILRNRKKHSGILQNARMFSCIRDSKKISEQKREFFYKQLVNHPQIQWGIGVVFERTIDRINILKATKLAMEKALRQVQGRLKQKPDFLLIDGNFGIDIEIPQKSIIAADQKVFSCTAAGIIAKVTRDKILQELHKKYPQYGFNRHKGYGTKLHFKNLQKFGPCKIHRKTFYPVRSLQ